MEDNNKKQEVSEKEKAEATLELIEKGKVEITPSMIRDLASDSETRAQAIPLLAKYFISIHRILTLSDTSEIFIYEKGVYLGSGDRKLEKESQRILEDYASIHFINEVLGHVRRSTYIKREEIIEPKLKICLENGVLDLETMQIEEHNPDKIFFNKIPIFHISSADCPLIKKFLREIMAYEEDLLVIQEFFGYCLLKDYPIHKAIMLSGNGANGKSTLIRLLKSFLGDKNCSSIPLQQMEYDKFALSNLFGKLVNLFADLSAKALRETSFFKMLTGEDQVPGEKKFKDKFFFTNYAKMIFSANKIPKSPDDSDAFFRRWIIINFPNQFIGKSADKSLLKKITSPEELSGLLNFAIEGLRRLLAQGDFSSTKGIQETREIYIRKSDSVAAFCLDCIEIKVDDHVEKKILYTEYVDYCRRMNYPAVPENTFHKELQMSIRIEDYKKRDGGQRVTCWRGIKLINIPNRVDSSDHPAQDMSGQDGQGGQGKLPI